MNQNFMDYNTQWIDNGIDYGWYLWNDTFDGKTFLGYTEKQANETLNELLKGE